MSDYCGAIFYAKTNKLENVFYESLNAICKKKLLLCPASDITLASISVTLRKHDCDMNVFIANDYIEAFRLTELTSEDKSILKRQFKDLSLIDIKETPTLLHCIARGDKEGFKSGFPSCKTSGGVLPFCDNLHRLGHYGGKEPHKIIPSLDIQKIISSNANKNVFGELCEILEFE